MTTAIYTAPAGVTSIDLPDGTRVPVVGGQFTADTKFNAWLEASGCAQLGAGGLTPDQSAKLDSVETGAVALTNKQAVETMTGGVVQLTSPSGSAISGELTYWSPLNQAQPWEIVPRSPMDVGWVLGNEYDPVVRGSVVGPTRSSRKQVYCLGLNYFVGDRVGGGSPNNLALIDREIEMALALGFDTVRLHNLDVNMVPLSTSNASNLTGTTVAALQAVSDANLVAAVRLFLWRARHRGLRVLMDINTHAYFAASVVPDYKHKLLLGDATAIALWTNFVLAFYAVTSVHDPDGYTVLNDPALWGVVLANESPFNFLTNGQSSSTTWQTLYKAAWNTFLLGKYGTRAAMNTAWGGMAGRANDLYTDEDPATGTVRTPSNAGVAGDGTTTPKGINYATARAADFDEFIGGLELGWYAKGKSILHANGLPAHALVLNQQAWQSFHDGCMRAKMDGSSGHLYGYHPFTATNDGAADGGGQTWHASTIGFLARGANTNSVYGFNLFGHINLVAWQRIFGAPFVLDETGIVFPSRAFGENIANFSQSAAQGFTAMVHFTDSYRLATDPSGSQFQRRIQLFTGTNDPRYRQYQRAGALMFRGGAVLQHTARVALVNRADAYKDPQSVRSSGCLLQVADGYIAPWMVAAFWARLGREDSSNFDGSLNWIGRGNAPELVLDPMSGTAIFGTEYNAPTIDTSLSGVPDVPYGTAAAARYAFEVSRRLRLGTGAAFYPRTAIIPAGNGSTEVATGHIVSPNGQQRWNIGAVVAGSWSDTMCAHGTVTDEVEAFCWRVFQPTYFDPIQAGAITDIVQATDYTDWTLQTADRGMPRIRDSRRLLGQLISSDAVNYGMQGNITLTTQPHLGTSSGLSGSGTGNPVLVRGARAELMLDLPAANWRIYGLGANGARIVRLPLGSLDADGMGYGVAADGRLWLVLCNHTSASTLLDGSAPTSAAPIASGYRTVIHGFEIVRD